MKAIVEEQEVQSSARPVSQEQSRQTIARAVPRLAESQPRMIDTPSNVEERESCCDLAAEFLARG